MSLEAQRLPSEFVCPQCQAHLDMHSPVTQAAAEQGVHRGLLMVCGHCAAFLRVGDSVLERLTVAQFKAAGPEMQRLLGLARRQIEMRNANGN